MTTLLQLLKTATQPAAVSLAVGVAYVWRWWLDRQFDERAVERWEAEGGR